MAIVVTSDQLDRLSIEGLREFCRELGVDFRQRDPKSVLIDKLKDELTVSDAATQGVAEQVEQWARQKARSTGDARYKDAYQAIASLSRDGRL